MVERGCYTILIWRLDPFPVVQIWMAKLFSFRWQYTFNHNPPLLKTQINNHLAEAGFFQLGAIVFVTFEGGHVPPFGTFGGIAVDD